MENQQTPMQNKRSLIQNQQSCTEYPLDGLQRGIKRNRTFLTVNRRKDRSEGNLRFVCMGWGGSCGGGPSHIFGNFTM